MKKQTFLTISSALVLTAFLQANAQTVQAEEVSEISQTNAQTVQAEEGTGGNQATSTSEASTSLSTQNADGSSAGTASAEPTTHLESSETKTTSETSPASAEPTTRSTTTATPTSTVILHTNDIHGRMAEETNNNGTTVIGMAKVASLVEEERNKANQTTLVLDAGDAFQGLPISNASQGDDMATLMNSVGYDAMAVGNHEFDFGLDQVTAYKQKLNFPLLSANTYVNGARLFEASTIIDKDTTIIGDEVVVIGVTTPETSTKTHPNNVIGVSFLDPISEVKKVIEQTEATARATGASYDKYIILAHLGVDASTPSEWRGDTLAQALADYDLLTGKTVIVIDGHSHTLYSATFGNNVTYNQTGNYLNNLGKITINSDGSVDAGVISARSTTNTIPNADVSAIVEDAKANFAAENATVVVNDNTVTLDGTRENVRVRETNLGNAIADALYTYGQTGFSNPTDLAVTNGGGIRATILKDQPITRGDIIAVLPFGNIISQIEVSGSQILSMFETSLSAATQIGTDGNPVLDEKNLPLLAASGGFLHTSGVRVYFDPTAPSGSRVLRVEILDRNTQTYQALDSNRTYFLATNDFLAAGGDGYTMLGGSREEGPSLDSVFANYLASLTNLSAYESIVSYNRTIPIDKTLDSDGDGITDDQELLNGTDPFVANPTSPTTDPEQTTTARQAVQVSSLGTQVSSLGTLVKAQQVSSARSHSYDKDLGSLPETGENQSNYTAYGLGLLSMAGLLAHALRKRKND